MEFKLFTKPKYHDEAWYRDREQADHIHQEGHRERLIEAVERVEQLYKEAFGGLNVCDLGCGNGGLLKTLRDRNPDMELHGYDLCPDNVKHAQNVYGVSVQLEDFTNPLRWPNLELGGIVVLTEVLEHLVEPHRLIEMLRRHPGVRFIVASSPAAETPAHHYEFHIWAWTGDSYAKMFERAGWKIDRHYSLGVVSTQFVVAHR